MARLAPGHLVGRRVEHEIGVAERPLAIALGGGAAQQSAYAAERSSTANGLTR
jgi:hypothetical protein